jgi:predicted DCC family thiol-disulfide oxidoreductase YuxK
LRAPARRADLAKGRQAFPAWLSGSVEVNPMLPKLTVWYNTKCPVCNAGISWQQNRLLEAVRTNQIEFRDINLEPDALARFGASLEDVRRRLHGLDPFDRLYTGAACASEIWLRARGDRWLGRLTKLPVIRSLAATLYDGFADLLYRWNRSKGHW